MNTNILKTKIIIWDSETNICHYIFLSVWKLWTSIWHFLLLFLSNNFDNKIIRSQCTIFFLPVEQSVGKEFEFK